jgi:uncharacterized repeat protein (TIGR02543 family)
MCIKRNGILSKYLLLHNGNKLKKGFHNSTVEIWSAGGTVTYIVDENVSYSEEVDSGATCLSPTTFTPSKDGWTFIGWRDDVSASKDVLGEKVMDNDSVTLYAVYDQDVTATFYSGENKTVANPVTGTRYYNGFGITVNAAITVPGEESISGWEWRGWSDNGKEGADEPVAYGDGDVIMGVSEDRAYYGLYQRDITLTYDGGGSDSGSVTSQTGVRYYNSAGNYSNPTFTLAANGFEKADYDFIGWDLGAAGSIITLTESKTAYAQWEALPIQWVQNSVAADGQTLTVTQTNSTATDMSVSGSSLNIPAIVGNDDQEYGINPTVSCETNYINTKGNNKMEIIIASVFGNTTRLYVNDQLVCGPFENVSYNLTYTVDVTPNTDVKLVFHVGNWALSQSGSMNITSVRFYSE